MESPKPCERPEYTIDFSESVYGRKSWSNPKRTNHRVYIHRFEDKQKVECGYVDLVEKKYIPPSSNRVHADFDLGFVDAEEGSVATIIIVEETFFIGYGVTTTEIKTAEKVVESKEKKNESANLKILEHIASITESDSKVTISYGNTVEVKTRQNGFIQSQYPKFSLSVELDGGNTIPKLVEAANAVVDVVEEQLTAIINELTKK